MGWRINFLTSAARYPVLSGTFSMEGPPRFAQRGSNAVPVAVRNPVKVTFDTPLGPCEQSVWSGLLSIFIVSVVSQGSRKPSPHRGRRPGACALRRLNNLNYSLFPSCRSFTPPTVLHRYPIFILSNIESILILSVSFTLRANLHPTRRHVPVSPRPTRGGAPSRRTDHVLHWDRFLREL